MCVNRLSIFTLYLSLLPNFLKRQQIEWIETPSAGIGVPCLPLSSPIAAGEHTAAVKIGMQGPTDFLAAIVPTTKMALLKIAQFQRELAAFTASQKARGAQSRTARTEITIHAVPQLPGSIPNAIRTISSLASSASNSAADMQSVSVAGVTSLQNGTWCSRRQQCHGSHSLTQPSSFYES